MATRNTPRNTWYHQPVVWLGVLIFLASLAGCVWMIVLGARHADEPLPTGGTTIMKMPTDRPPATADPPGTPP